MLEGNFMFHLVILASRKPDISGSPICLMARRIKPTSYDLYPRSCCRVFFRPGSGIQNAHLVEQNDIPGQQIHVYNERFLSSNVKLGTAVYHTSDFTLAI